MPTNKKKASPVIKTSPSKVGQKKRPDRLWVVEMF
jgi:hypothetical protein